MFSAFFLPTLLPNAEAPSHRETPLLGREILCSRGNGERFHLQNPEGTGEAGTEDTFPRSLQPGGTTTRNLW